MIFRSVSRTERVKAVRITQSSLEPQLSIINFNSIIKNMSASFFSDTYYVSLAFV